MVVRGIARVRIHHVCLHHCRPDNVESKGLGVSCVIREGGVEVVTTPMYIVTSDNKHSPQRQKKEDQGDSDQDSGSAKYVHLPKGPDNSTIRVDNSTEAGQSGCAGVTVTVTQPVTLLLKDLLESPTVGFPRRVAGHPGCAEGNSAKWHSRPARRRMRVPAVGSRGPTSS